MGTLKIVLFTLCSLQTFLPSLAQNETEPDKPPLLLLISFDGFRWDYLDKVKAAGGSTPNFDTIISTGVKAEYMKNAFITKTFPNHYTIVTGLYEETHGVVANEMFDPVFNETFELAQSNSPNPELNKWFNNGTSSSEVIPIWTLNQLQTNAPKGKTNTAKGKTDAAKGKTNTAKGKTDTAKGKTNTAKGKTDAAKGKTNAPSGHGVITPTGKPRHSGVVMWPGSTAKIHSMLPSHLVPYNKTIANETRIDTIIKWFTQEENPINFGALYFSEPDHTGHQVGPDSPVMMKLIQALDKLIGYMIHELKKHDLWDTLNVIITSDHGMANINGILQMDKYVDLSWFSSYGSSPVLGILPIPGKEEAVYKALQKIPNSYCYWKKDIPREYYYTYNVRIQPILLLAQEGFAFCPNAKNCAFVTKGNHGYNNSIPDMHPLFIARGPAFKEGIVSKPFNNVDVYSLMCKILGLEPMYHQGDIKNVYHLLEDSLFNDTDTLIRAELTKSTLGGGDIALWVVGGMAAFAACIASIFCLAAARPSSRAKYSKLLAGGMSRDSKMGYVPLLSHDAEEEDELP